MKIVYKVSVVDEHLGNIVISKSYSSEEAMMADRGKRDDEIYKYAEQIQIDLEENLESDEGLGEEK